MSMILGRRFVTSTVVSDFFFHSFIGCSSCDIQYKFIIQHAQKKKEKRKKRSKNPKGVGATGLTSHASHRP